MDRVGEWLLAIDVLAQLHGGHRGHGMDVVGRADGDGVDVLLLLQHDPEIRVPLGLGKLLEGASRPVLVDVAKGHDVGTVLGRPGNVAGTLASRPDAGDVDTFVGTPHAFGNKLKGKCRGSGRPEEAPARIVVCLFHLNQWNLENAYRSKI